MANLNATAVGEKAVRLGLISLGQLQEAKEDFGALGENPESLLRFFERKGYLTPWQSQKLLKDDPDGYFLGGYRILYKIASGSFGRVYRADDPSSGTVVAIKVLRRKWSDDPHNIDLFEREGKLGMSLRHPNVVEILAVNRDPATQQYYIVMEFVEGGNLRDILAIRKKMEPRETFRIVEEATSGLAYAFSRGISHRDMKPSNILISSQGTAKLVDFGLAGVYGKKEEKATVERTVDYAGLERATGTAPGDIRSDIYFLGCVAYEMLTGRCPLEMPKDARARMDRERFLNVQPMDGKEVAAPPSAFRLVSTMMALNPAQRFQTPSQLLDGVRETRRELEGASAGLPASSTHTLFFVEKDERLQDLLRDKFKQLGYRVLIAADPVRAIERFNQQAFDVLIVDAATTGIDGILVFDRIMDEAIRNRQACAGIVILSQELADWEEKIPIRDNQSLLIHPVKLKQLQKELERLLARAP